MQTANKVRVKTLCCRRCCHRVPQQLSPFDFYSTTKLIGAIIHNVRLFSIRILTISFRTFPIDSSTDNFLWHFWRGRQPTDRQWEIATNTNQKKKKMRTTHIYTSRTGRSTNWLQASHIRCENKKQLNFYNQFHLKRKINHLLYDLRQSKRDEISHARTLSTAITEFNDWMVVAAWHEEVNVWKRWNTSTV